LKKFIYRNLSSHIGTDMPKKQRAFVQGMVDYQAFQILESLSELKSFSVLQKETKFPKSSLHKVIQRLLDSNLIYQIGRNYEPTVAAKLLVSTIERLNRWTKIALRDHDIVRAINDVERTRNLELRGYSVPEQLQDLLEAVENVKVTAESPKLR